MNKFIKELLLLVFVATPYAYLLIMWNSIPEKVAIHFNLEGQANGWANKSLLYLLPGVGVALYIIMLIIPQVKFNKRIEEMGGKYYTLRLILALFTTAFSSYLIYLCMQGSANNANIIIALVGATIALLGNYFQTIRPNYFIGIRTPWTLRDEQVWRKTHRMGGLLWMGAGCLLFVSSFFLSFKALLIFMGLILLTIAVIPATYSYKESKKANPQQR